MTINSQGLFGIQTNSVDTATTSDITASSENGPQGTVTINTPNVQPNTGLINLASQPIPFRFARLCENSNENQTLIFTNIGRGGELPAPDGFLPVEMVEIPWLDLQLENVTQPNNLHWVLSSVALFLPCQ